MIRKTLFSWLSRTFFILLLVVAFLLSTNTGFKTTLWIVKRSGLGQVSASTVNGSLLGSPEIYGLRLSTPSFQLQASAIKLIWSPWRLLAGHIAIDELVVDKGNLSLHQIKEQEDNSDSSFSLPHVSINRLNANRFFIHRKGHRYGLYQLALEELKLGEESRLKKFAVNVDGVQLTAYGQYSTQKQRPLLFVLKGQGKAHFEAIAKGTLKGYQFDASITRPHQATIHATLNDKSQFNLELLANYLQLTDEQSISNGKITASGDNNAMTIQAAMTITNEKAPSATLIANASGNLKALVINNLQLNTGGGYLHAKGRISLSPKVSWQVNTTLSQLDLSPVSPALKSRLSGTINSQGSTSPKLSMTNQLKLNGQLLAQALSANGEFNIGKKSQLSARLGSLRFRINGKRFNGQVADLAKVTPAFSNITGPANFVGEIGNTSLLTLNLGKGAVRLDSGDTIPYKKANLRATYLNKVLKLYGQVTLTDANQGRFNGELRLNNDDIVDSKINSTVSFQLNELSTFDSLIEQIEKPTGSLRGKIEVFNTLKNPKLAINATLNADSVLIKPINITIHRSQVSLNSSHQQWRLTGLINSEKGRLSLEGNGSTSLERPNYRLSIRGQDVELVNNTEYQIFASPKLAIQTKDNHLFLSGEITIPKARISPTDFSSSVELPSDVVIVKHGKPLEKTVNFGYQLHIKLGKEVKLNTFGLTGDIKGALKINAPANKPSQAFGKLEVLNGKFDAYGQHLKMTQGEISFNGGPVDNPLLNVTAIRELNRQSEASSLSQSTSYNLDSFDNLSDVVVGLRASGYASHPKITLFSNPPTLSQADILSMIILGRPVNQADSTDGGGQALAGAIASLGLGGGSSGQQLTDEVQHSLGFDIGLETQSNYNSEDGTISNSPALVVGKALSSKIYLQYSAGFGDGGNIIRILYRFRKNWSLITETDGSANAVDVLYNFQRK